MGAPQDPSGDTGRLPGRVALTIAVAVRVPVNEPLRVLVDEEVDVVVVLVVVVAVVVEGGGADADRDCVGTDEVVAVDDAAAERVLVPLDIREFEDMLVDVDVAVAVVERDAVAVRVAIAEDVEVAVDAAVDVRVADKDAVDVGVAERLHGMHGLQIGGSVSPTYCPFKHAAPAATGCHSQDTVVPSEWQM